MTRTISYKTDRDYTKPFVKSKRNVSGAIGISIIRTPSKDGSTIWESYVAKFTVDGVDTKRTFSTNKYGECLAFDKACWIRHKHCGVIIITDEKAIPCLPTVNWKFGEKDDKNNSSTS